jgi:hypothetical protein
MIPKDEIKGGPKVEGGEEILQDYDLLDTKECQKDEDSANDYWEHCVCVVGVVNYDKLD